ncbi:TraR/DksA family transcriptional regulator [Aquabacterium sp.]|uniref:TraR/DksA family transcriptional regulator n=1 Tax=Aquabacterium sp. TaxID=1872578 RepID=UPI003783FD6D
MTNTSSALQDLQARLLARREELAGEVAREQQHPDDLSHEVRDRKEEAQAREQDEVAAAETERDVAELREIDAALARLAAGRYGLCTECGEPIEAARLQVQATAARCMGCQRAAESPTR